MLYVTPPINTFILCSITVNSELAHLWIRLLKSFHKVKEMENMYSILYFDPGKVWVCFKKKKIHVITIKLNTMQSL